MVGGCSPVWEGVPQSGRVCPSVGGCVPVWEDVSQYRRVSPSVGGFAPVWEDVPLYMCVCEVWVSLSRVLRMDTQVRRPTWLKHPESAAFD